MKHASLILLVIILAASLAACVPAGGGNTLKIGLQGPMTGDYAYEGKGFQNAVKLLVEQTNAAGGINGQQVELFVEDDKGDPKEASLVADRLVSNKVTAVIGGYNSTATEPASEIYDRGRHPPHHAVLHSDPPDDQGLPALLPRLLPG